MTTAILANRVRVLTATVGTGTVTLGAAYSNAFCTFAEAGITNAQVVRYVIEEGTDFEIGLGTYTSSGTTLSRDTVNLSKIGGTAGTSKMTLAGAATVRIECANEDIIARLLAASNLSDVASVGTSRANLAVGTLTFSGSAPGSPNAGDTFIDNTTGIRYTYVNDGNTSQWVEFDAASATPLNYLPLTGGTLTGQAFFDLAQASQTYWNVRNTNASAGARAGYQMGNATQNNAGLLFLNGTGSTDYAGAGSLNIGTVTATSLGLFTSNTVRLYLTSGGKVGVNMSPGRDLDISDAAATGGILQLSGAFGAQVTGTVSGVALFASNAYAATNSSTLKSAGTHANYGYSGMYCHFGQIDFFSVTGTATTADATITPTSVLNFNGAAARFAASVVINTGSTTPVTLANNGDFTLTPTSNTNFRISYRGSDGTTRVGNITLA